MLKSLFICMLFYLSPVQLIIAQDEKAHSIAELNSLLQKNNADSQRVKLLLKAAFVYILRPGMKKSDFDSTLFFLNRAMNLSTSLNDPVWQARCFQAYSQLYREGNQKEKGKKYIDSAISIFTKYNRKEDLADTYTELGRYYDIYAEDQWAWKVKYTELAEQLYRESGSRLKQIMSLKDLGDFYQITEKDSIALNHLQEALAIAKTVNYQEVEGIYDLIGYILDYDNDFQQALKYGLLAVETAERVNASSQELSTIYNRVGVTYYGIGQYREAANYFTKAFAMAMSNKDSLNARIIAPNVTDSYLRLENQKEMIAFLQHQRFIYDIGTLNEKVYYLADYIRAYLLTNNYKKAEPLVADLLRLVGTNPNLYELRSLHRAVIQYYLASGQYRAMYNYLPANETICKKHNIIGGLADNYLWWYKADSALGNSKDAIAHYKLFKEASDSLLRFTASQQINQLKIQFETAKKDQEIRSKEGNIRLLTNEAKLQQANLKQATLVKNLTISGIIAVLIIAGLLFRQSKLRQKSNNVITQKNEQLQHLVNEKEWLIKEIHHRVKNNLQIVMSLLNSQSVYIDNEQALTAIHDSQHRVHAMSLIHQKLYSSENVSSIDMPVYIRELVSYLGDSFETGQRIRFEYDVKPLELDVSQAVPLGLILNEAITNSIKYAFPDGRNGVISISLSNTTSNHYLLSISDNGIGMPPGFNTKKTGSLGMSLMKGLSEDLDGNLSIENNDGTTIKVSFAHDAGVKRQDIFPSSFVSNN